jgi:hypothetical protein
MRKFTSQPKLMKLNYLKTTATCLRGLQSILLQRPSALGFTEGLGFVQAFWLIGLPEYDSSKFPPTAAEPGPPPPTAQSASKVIKNSAIQAGSCF